MSTNQPTLRVLFIHGLEGSPQGAKVQFLRRHFETHAAAMDTTNLEGCVETQAAAVAAFRPDVVVGSSFGGAVTVRLLARGDWRGPTVLLAPAAAKLGVRNELPEGVAVTVVHATHDAIIARADCVALAATGTPALVTLREVDDEHRLATLLDTGLLAELVRDTASRQPR